MRRWRFPGHAQCTETAPAPPEHSGNACGGSGNTALEAIGRQQDLPAPPILLFILKWFSFYGKVAKILEIKNS